MEALVELPRPEYIPVRLTERVGWALDETLGADLDEHFAHDDHLVTAELAELQRHKARLAALEARLIERWDSRKSWAADGSKSASSALAREGGLSAGSAKALVGRARKLRTMPVTARALAAGAISTDQVDLLCKANQEWRDARFAEHERMLVRHCRRLRYPYARKVVDYWCQRADALAAEHDATTRYSSRYASTATTLGGEVVLHGVLDAVGGSAFCDELQRLERALYLDDRKTGNARTIRQRRADALVEMAHRSRTSPPNGLRPRPLITFLVGEQSFAKMCELAEGTVITPGQVVPHLADAEIERIVFDGPDRVMGVSRRRAFTGALRRAIEVRDRHCRHLSGCDESAKDCDVDHITPRSEGGFTSQPNGRLLCPTHNRHPHKRDPRPPPGSP
jgi:5-methylcytosine-specific restriction endonuclease McrA